MNDSKQTTGASDGSGIFSVEQLSGLIGSDIESVIAFFDGCFESGIFLCKNDFNLTIRFSSVSARRLCGGTNDEFLRLTQSGLTGIVRPACRQAVREAAKRAQAGGVFCADFQVNIPDKDIWLKITGKLLPLSAGEPLFALICTDCTKDHYEIENARLREQELNIAVSHCNVDVMRYDPEKKRLSYLNGSRAFGLYSNAEYLDNVPDVFIINGHVPDDSIMDLLGFFDSIRQGKPEESCVVRFCGDTGVISYVRMSYTLAPETGGAARQAIITSENITELRKNELEFDSWSRMNDELRAQSSQYALCNLSKDRFIYAHYKDGRLSEDSGEADTRGLDAMLVDIAEKYTHPDDRKKLQRFLNRQRLLNAFKYDVTEGALEYRSGSGGAYSWTRLKLRCIKKPGSGDIIAFIYSVDIDAEKKSAEKEYAKKNIDPLTGVLREDVFKDRASELFAHSEGESHALFMIDIDDLRELNSRVGRLLCDNALKTLADVLRSTLRTDDLIGRINGDEFFVCMKNISPDDSLIRKAQFISSLLRVELAGGVFLTASMGVAAYPRNGESYDELFKNASIALKEANKLGKNRFVIYQSYMFHDEASGEASAVDAKNAEAAMPAAQPPEQEKSPMAVTPEEAAEGLAEPDKAAALLNAFVSNMIGGMMLIEVGEKLSLIYISSGCSEIIKSRGDQTSAERIRTLFPHIHQDDSARLEALLRRAAQSSVPVEFVFRIIGADDAIRYTQMRAVHIRYPELSSPVIMAMIVDVTEQMQTTEHLKSIINNVPGGVGLYEWGETLRPLLLGESLVNKRESSHRLESQKLIEADALNAVDDDDRDRIASLLRDWQKQRANCEVEYHMNERIYGPGRYTKVSCARIGAIGKSTLVTAVFSETTEQKKQETKLRAQHEADVALLMKLSHGLALSDVVLFEFDYEKREGEMLKITEPYARSEVRHINLDDTLERYVKNGYIHPDSINKYNYISKWVYEDNIPRARTKLLVRWPNEREYTNTRIAYLVDSEKGKPRTIFVAAWKVE